MCAPTAGAWTARNQSAAGNPRRHRQSGKEPAAPRALHHKAPSVPLTRAHSYASLAVSPTARPLWPHLELVAAALDHGIFRLDVSVAEPVPVHEGDGLKELWEAGAGAGQSLGRMKAGGRKEPKEIKAGNLGRSRAEDTEADQARRGPRLEMPIQGGDFYLEEIEACHGLGQLAAILVEQVEEVRADDQLPLGGEGRKERG